MSNFKKIDVRNAVRNSYSKIARQNTDKSSCCSGNLKLENSPLEISRKIGYSDEEILVLECKRRRKRTMSGRTAINKAMPVLRGCWLLKPFRHGRLQCWQDCNS